MRFLIENNLVKAFFHQKKHLRGVSFCVLSSPALTLPTAQSDVIYRYVSLVNVHSRTRGCGGLNNYLKQ